MTDPRAVDPLSPLSSSELAHLQRRSDVRGLLRLAGHLAAIIAAGGLVTFVLERRASWGVVLLAELALGFTLVTMFAAMHEAVHRTAFRSPRLNDGVGWFAGLLSFYNSTFYRPYHGWHHRFTQLTGRDPELEDPKPTGILSYLIELSAVTWWIGKLKTHGRLALGNTAPYPFLNEQSGPRVVRSVRLQLTVYVAGIVASAALGRPYFLLLWLAPVALAQPLLRAILLAEHTGCTEDANALANTRTTYTLWPVRFLMWEMPYHAEHHRYPALPFFALAEAHRSLGPHLAEVARSGYAGFHVGLWRSFGKARSVTERA